MQARVVPCRESCCSSADEMKPNKTTRRVSFAKALQLRATELCKDCDNCQAKVAFELTSFFKTCCEMCKRDTCCKNDDCCGETCCLLKDDDDQRSSPQDEDEHVDESDSSSENVAEKDQHHAAKRKGEKHGHGHDHDDHHSGCAGNDDGKTKEKAHKHCEDDGGKCGRVTAAGDDHAHQMKKKKKKHKKKHEHEHDHDHDHDHEHEHEHDHDHDHCNGDDDHDHEGHKHGEGDSCCSGEPYVPKPIDTNAEGITVCFTVTGVTCADCSLRVEKKLLNQAGIFEVCISSVTQRADVRFDEAVIRDVAIQKLIEDMGFGARIISQLAAAHLTVRVAKRSDEHHGSDSDASYQMEEEAVPPVQDVGDKIRGLPGVAFVGVKEKKNRWRRKREGFHVFSIDYDPDQVGARDLIRQIEGSGYATQLIAEKDTVKKSTNNSREVWRLSILFAISALLGVPVLLIAFVFAQIPATDAAFDTELTKGLSVGVFLEWLLTTPIQFGVGYGLYVSTFRSLWYTRKANVDTLVVLSTTTAYVYSVITTILAMSLSGYESTPFFETSAILIMLIMLGRLLESLTRRKTSNVLTKLLELQADSTILLHKEGDEVVGEEELAIELVQKGDILKVLPGTKVPMDGVVVFGSSSVDESMVTGESLPLTKDIGDQVYGGTINQNGTLHIMTTSTVSDSMLASIRKMVEQAQTLKPPIQRIADVISSYFTPLVLVISALVFILWCSVAATTDVDTGSLHFVPFSLQFAITVLVVSCPCAIGLATPTAIMVGTGVAARKGILFKGGPAMEACHKLDTLVFDKTGTLTAGKPSVTGCQILLGDGRLPLEEERFWHILGSAESGSEHALGRALIDHAKRQTDRPLTEPEDFEATPGKGITCSVAGSRVLVGNRRFVSQRVSIPEFVEADAAELEQQGNTVVWVVLDEQLVGYVSLADEPRPEAEAVVQQLQRMGIEVWLVSGDNSRTVNAIASRLGIDNAIGDVLPGGKAEKVRELQERKSGRSWRRCWRRRKSVVGMVGDGVNDSPALTQADTGIAVGAGMDIAVQAADIVLVKSDMRDILVALHLSRITFRRILINFGWAFLYNVIAIPLAGGILYPATTYAFPPAVAGLSEIVSTLPVIFSSLLLRLYRSPRSVRKLYKQQGPSVTRVT